MYIHLLHRKEVTLKTTNKHVKMWLNRNCQDLFIYQPPSSSTPYQTYKSSGRVLGSTKNSIFPPQSFFFCWAAGGIVSEDETLTPPASVPSESSLVWNCLSVRKKCSLSNLFSSCHHQGLPLSPGSCSPQKRKKEKKKPSPNLITLMFHQVERSGWRHLGISILRRLKMELCCRLEEKDVFHEILQLSFCFATLCCKFITQLNLSQKTFFFGVNVPTNSQTSAFLTLHDPAMTKKLLKLNNHLFI